MLPGEQRDCEGEAGRISFRCATSAKVATLWNTADTVYLASGEEFADGLSGGGAAARAKAPLLLTTTNGLPDETAAALKLLKPSKIIIVGETGAVSAGVMDAVEAEVPGATVTRVGGKDRYETSAKLLPSGPITKLMLASGEAFADALAGIPASTSNGAAFALSTSACMPASVRSAVGSNSIGQYFLLGGQSVLNSLVETVTCD